MAMRAVSQIEERFGVNLSLAGFLEAPTIAGAGRETSKMRDRHPPDPRLFRYGGNTK